MGSRTYGQSSGCHKPQTLGFRSVIGRKHSSKLSAIIKAGSEDCLLIIMNHDALFETKLLRCKGSCAAQKALSPHLQPLYRCFPPPLSHG